MNWSIPNSQSDNELSKILTITACAWFLSSAWGAVLCIRLYKSPRNTSQVYDQAISNFQAQRAYEELPENSVLYESDIERMFPKEMFREELLEVGEKVCCICLEE